MIMVCDDPETVEADLAAGRLRCPSCAGALRPWGWSTPRSVRTLSGERHLRPRRAHCPSCEVSPVLLPAWCLPRRRDAAEVVLSALAAKAGGDGHRKIAARIGRPPGTVRGWLRRAVDMAEAIRATATSWAHALDPCLGPIEPSGSVLGDAVNALGTAIAAGVRRLGPSCESEFAVRYGLGLLSPSG